MFTENKITNNGGPVILKMTVSEKSVLLLTQNFSSCSLLFYQHKCLAMACIRISWHPKTEDDSVRLNIIYIVSLFRFSLINFTFWYLTLFSKFYFNFPSQYLFAIGFTVVFSVSSHLRAVVIFIQQSQAVLLLNLQSWNNPPIITVHCETFTLNGSVFQPELEQMTKKRMVTLQVHKLQFDTRADSCGDFNFALCTLFTRRY